MANLGRTLHRRYNLTSIYSSPLERAMETATLIAGEYGLKVIAESGLNELDAGRWTGARFDELQANEQWREYNAHRSLRAAPEGESLLDVQVRAWASLHKIVMQYEGEEIAAVTHGDVIRALLMLFLGMPLDYLLRLEVSPASVSEISISGGQTVVHRINALLVE